MEPKPNAIFDLSEQQRRRLADCVMGIANDPTRSVADRLAAVRVVIQIDWLNLTAETVGLFQGHEANDLLHALRQLAKRIV